MSEASSTLDHSDDIQSGVPRMWLVSALSGVGSMAFRITGLVILGRLLGPEDFGLTSMVMAVLGIATVLQDLGLSGAVVRAQQITPGQSSSLFLINAALGLFMTALAFASAGYLAELYADLRVTGVAQVLAFNFVMTSLGAQHIALMRRHLKFKPLAIINVVAVGSGQICSVAMAFQGMGYWSLVSGLLLTSGVRTSLAWAMEWSGFARPVWDKRLFALIQFGGWLTVHAVLGYLAMNIHSVIIGRLYDANEVGVYGRAFAIFTLITAFIGGPLGLVVPAALSRLRDVPERYGQTYLDSLAMQLLMVAGMSVWCWSVGGEFIGLVLGEGWTRTGEILSILALSAVPQAICASSGWLYMSHGDSKRMMQWGLGGWSALIVMLGIGALSGVKGIAWAYTIGMWVLVYPCMILAFKRTQLCVRQLVTSQSPIVGAAIVAGASIEVLRIWIPASSSFWWLLLTAVVFLMSYLCLLVFPFRRGALLKGLWRRIRHKRDGGPVGETG